MLHNTMTSAKYRYNNNVEIFRNDQCNSKQINSKIHDQFTHDYTMYSQKDSK